MGDLINLPTLAIDFIKAGRMSWGRKGSATEGGRNGLGASVSMETSGGGILVGTYADCFAQSPEEHEYLNWVAARMDGSYRYMNIPILTDNIGPFPVDSFGVPIPVITGIPHSDGSFFSDGAGYSQATVFGTMGAAASLNAGQIVLNIFGASRNLRWSDWFSIYHPTKGWRAYRYWETTDPVPVTQTVDGVSYTGSQYTLSLDRPLREATAAATRIEFYRPRCVMKFPADFSLQWEVADKWVSRHTMMFEEAMS